MNAKQFIDSTLERHPYLKDQKLKAILPIEDESFFDKSEYRGLKLEFWSVPGSMRYITEDID